MRFGRANNDGQLRIEFVLNESDLALAAEIVPEETFRQLIAFCNEPTIRPSQWLEVLAEVAEAIEEAHAAAGRKAQLVENGDHYFECACGYLSASGNYDKCPDCGRPRSETKAKQGTFGHAHVA